MELKDKITRLAALLDKHPKIESEPGLTTLATKLENAINAFLDKSEMAVYRNTAEYSELIALLGMAQNNLIF